MAVRLDRGLISRRGSTETLTFSRCKTDSTHKTHLPGRQRELYNLLGLSSFSSCSLVRILRQRCVPLMSHESDHSTHMQIWISSYIYVSLSIMQWLIS